MPIVRMAELVVSPPTDSQAEAFNLWHCMWKGMQGVVGIYFTLDEAINTEASIQISKFPRTMLF